VNSKVRRKLGEFVTIINKQEEDLKI